MATANCFIKIGKADRYHGGIRPRVIGHFYENEGGTSIGIFKRKGLTESEYVGNFLPEWKTTKDPVVEPFPKYSEGELKYLAHPIIYMIIASFREPCAKSDKLREISREAQKESLLTLPQLVMKEVYNYREENELKKRLSKKLKEAREIVGNNEYQAKIVVSLLSPARPIKEGILRDLEKINATTILLEEKQNKQ